MEFLTIAVLHFFAVSSPGPDYVIVTRQSVRSGRSAALFTSLGIAFGILVHSFAAMTGLTYIISSNPLIFLYLKILAALYLAYLGFISIFQSSSVNQSSSDILSTDSLYSFRIGFITNVLNPKAILFFVTVFSIVLDSSTSLILLAFYGSYMAVATFVWFSLVAYLFTNPEIIRKYSHFLPKFEKILGCLLLLIAFQIILYELPNINVY
jgi:threonine/homoserine/homoserine lactone efflux protein|tara:strand:+ start:3983 stop:4609 length:627 start_codon:yes stop_codon:yes gene_type:complete